MNKRADARRDTHGVTERSDATEDKRFGAKTYFFMNNLDMRVNELTRLRNEGASRRGCFDGNNILQRVDETIASTDSSIRVQLNTGLFLAIQKNPAVAAAGS